MKDKFLAMAAAVVSALVSSCSAPMAPKVVDSSLDIHNDCFWDTQDGKPIYSQGGGVFRFYDDRVGRERYFWYGVRYAECAKYRAEPVRLYDKRCTFEAVSLYTSDDLVNWTAETDALVADEVAKFGPLYWLGRMGVAKLQGEETFALFIQYNSSVLVATATSPFGPFSCYRKINMTSRIGTPNTGDQTVFTDTDGKSYLIYSYGKGRNRGYVSLIGREAETDSIGLVDCHEVFHGASREGNCMFRHDGKYYLCASNIYGWNSSLAYYLVSDSIYGPYEPKDDMQVMIGCEDDYAHVTQTGFFVTVAGSDQETVVYCGDRWVDFANNGLGFNQWVPLSFTEDGLPVFNSVSHWQLDAQTGRWSVGADNNYVLNPSFEADRRIIPLAKKPRQEHITGWKTEVLAGTPVGVDVPCSPHLNVFNSEEDQRHVVGKMSMLMSDTVAFHRRVSQEVVSRGDVVLPDADYVFSAKVNVEGSFSSLGVTVGDAESLSFAGLAGRGWQTVSCPVAVRGGRVQIVFDAVGSAGAACRIDDVCLLKKQ